MCAMPSLWCSEDSFQVSVLSCPHVIPRDKTQAISHGDKCLNSMSHLAIPKRLFQKIDNELHKALNIKYSPGWPETHSSTSHMLEIQVYTITPGYIFFISMFIFSSDFKI